MKKSREFKIGDKVFAKVKGYPAWPAHILAESGKKYRVEFYGTKETGLIKGEDICYYLKNKENYAKHAKRAGYAEAMEQIEAAIKKSGSDGDDGSHNDSVINGSDTASNASTTSLNSSRSEKRAPKRKTLSSDDEGPIKKSTRRRKSTITSESEGKEENDTQTNNTPKKAVSAKTAVAVKPEKPMRVEESGETAAVKTKKEPEEVKVKEPEFVSAGNADENLHSESEEKMIPNEESDSAVKVEIVVEKTLNNNILYAEHVRKHEDLYKSRPVDKRTDKENQVLPVKLASGIMCGVKLHKNWPLRFTNEYERALYDETVAKTALDIKKLLDSGEKKPENDEMIISNIHMSADDVKEITFDREVESKKKRIQRLKVEANLIDLDSKIKNCLGLDSASPKAALSHLKGLLKIKFDALMLKKHPHVVDMLRRLCKYVGNVKDWKMTEEEYTEFQVDAGNIRIEAEKVYNKIQDLIKIPDDSSTFWDGFLTVVSKFREQCNDLTEAQIYVLCAEPNSRQAFLDQLDELSEADNKETSGGAAKSEAVLNTTDEASSVQGWAEKSA